ncbi:MAG TPA: hypothetical protein PKA05_17950 [Roseiflexaceae bacterium]|nr:hypothetical protein [Roseiflexaceae bacterium]HMP42266.1 hypothetical protein [Roseiflexaceae bacterium]
MAVRQDESMLGQFDDQADIGMAGVAGSCAYDPVRQIYTITGAGANIWGDRDDFYFVWKRMAGNFIVTAHVGFVGDGAHAHRKLGWMARAGLDPAAPHVSAVVHGDGLLALQFRRSAGAPTEELRVDLHGADVIQLERQGTSYSMSAARFGEPFVSIQAGDLDLGDDLYVGLAVCSHVADQAETAHVHNVRLVRPVHEQFDRRHDPFGSHLEILDVTNGDRQIIYSADDVFEAPNWTRDGAALIYNRGGRLYRFDLAAHTHELIDTAHVVGNNNDHVISFDGTMLAISSHSDTERDSIIYTVPLQGGTPQRVTPHGPSYLHGWSPDGNFLVYTGLRNGDFDIYRISVEGGAETRLTTAIGLDDGPEYTPDGRYIYFNSVRSGRMQIWRMKADGSDQEQLTDDEYNNWFPHVAPDATSVIFVSYLVGEVEPSDHPPARRVYLRMMPLDGGTPRVLAYLYGGQGTMNVPSWSPDSRYVAFVSNTVPFS